MPKATLLPNIIDIACSLPSVRSQIRSHDGDLPRTSPENADRVRNVTYYRYFARRRLFLDDKTLLLQSSGILRNGSSGISRESKCSVRLESNSRARAERLLAIIENRRETRGFPRFCVRHKSR